MEQKFIAGLYFVFAMLTTNAMAQTPPPGTIPIATVTFPIMPFRPEISLDGDRIAIQTVGTQSFADFTRLAVIEKGSAGWVQIPVTSSIPFPSGGVGRPIAFEGNRIATDMVGLSGRNSPPPIIWGRTGTGWQLQAIPRFQEDLACAGFSPDGIYSFMFDSVTLPNGFTNGVLRVNACEAGLVKAKATLSPPSNPIGGYQLHRYALSGDTMVVGFKYSDGSIFPVIGASGFHAYVYNRSRTAAGAVWSFGGELPLPQSAVAANQIYSPGEDLAIDGNTIAISAPSEAMSVPGVGTVEAGAVYVFERAGATWTQKARLTRSRMNRHFGSRVAVSGDRLLVGSDITPFTVNPGPGEAYLYQRVNGLWNITPNVLRRIANSNDTLFGSGVALKGNTAAVTGAWAIVDIGGVGTRVGGGIQIYTLPPTTPPVTLELILDNLAAGLKETVGVGTVPGWRTFTGTWCTSISTDFFGTKSLYSCGGTADSYRWTPNIKTAGKYDVYIWYATNANRSTSVPITVASTTTPVTKIYNERAGGGRWILHGRYTFAAGRTGYVEVRAANGQAGADAVRLVSVP